MSNHAMSSIMSGFLDPRQLRLMNFSPTRQIAVLVLGGGGGGGGGTGAKKKGKREGQGGRIKGRKFSDIPQGQASSRPT